MTPWILLRLIKLLAVGLCVGGALGAGLASTPRDRQAAAFWLATPGLLLTWTAGHGLTGIQGASLAQPFIALTMVTSVMSFHHAVLACRQAGRRPPFAGLTAGWVAASIAAMVIREPGPALWFGVAGIGAAAGIGAWRLARSLEAASPGTHPPASEPVLRWFVWMGRLEAGSWILLMGVHMPLKYGAGINLDPGGLLGMAHGVLFVVYLQSVASAYRAAGWTSAELRRGLLASVIPAGPILFARRLS